MKSIAIHSTSTFVDEVKHLEKHRRLISHQVLQSFFVLTLKVEMFVGGTIVALPSMSPGPKVLSLLSSRSSMLP